MYLDTFCCLYQHDEQCPFVYFLIGLRLIISYLQVSIGLAVFCLPWLRWKHPEWERPIKVSLIWPVLYILATIFITIVPMVASPIETGMGTSCTLRLFIHENYFSRYWYCYHFDRCPSILRFHLLEKQAEIHSAALRYTFEAKPTEFLLQSSAVQTSLFSNECDFFHS